MKIAYKLGAAQKRVLAFVHGRILAGDTFPSVDEIVAHHVVTNRGHARNILASFEERGLAEREGHHWNTGSLTAAGYILAVRIQVDVTAGRTARKKAKRQRHAYRADLYGAGTIHAATVQDPRPPSGTTGVLMSGLNSNKIGATVTKGRLKGHRILSLSLEERATCPSTCSMWDACYGNNMTRSIRFRHGSALMRAIEEQLIALRDRPAHRFRPVLVRLHELGDFPYPDYVRKWHEWLWRFEFVSVFGYTAHAPESPVGREISLMRAHWRDRFAVRWSGRSGAMGAVVIKDGDAKPDDAFWCPEQQQRVANCGACGACWSTEKAVAFAQH